MNHRTGDSIFPISKLSKNKKFCCGADRDRTCDLRSASAALSQLSYSPNFKWLAVDQVGLRGLEPRTSSLSGMRSNHLSYKPIFRVCDGLADYRFDLSQIALRYSLKGGDPAAPSGTATLLRLRLVTNLTLTSSLPKVGPLDSGTTDFHGVTGGVYKTRERIHRSVLIHDY